MLIVLVIVIVAIALFWLLSKKEAKELTPKKTTSQLQQETKKRETESKNTAKTLTKEDQDKDEDDFSLYESQVLKAQVQGIANQFADTARFPIGSQPIRNLADARQPEPYEETEVETPFETEDGETIGVKAAVDRFQYFTNDTINVRLTLAGLPAGVFVESTATISGPQGDTPLEQDLRATDASQSLFIGSFDTSLASNEQFSKEMFVKVLVRVDGEPFLTTVSFSYDKASAQLEGLGVAQPRGANLEVPLEYSVFISGYYFVNAILRDQETGQPLIALQTEGRMTRGNGRLIAKAHIQALKETGSQGPYLLTDIKAYRGAERGEHFDVPASSVRTQYTIQGYAFSEYEDEKFEDPLTQERVEFLNELGNINTQNSDEQGGEQN